MSLDELKAEVEEEINALRKHLQRLDALLSDGKEVQWPGLVLKRGLLVKEATQKDLEYRRVAPGEVLAHREVFCMIIEKAQAQGYGPEIEEFAYSELEDVP